MVLEHIFNQECLRFVYCVSLITLLITYTWSSLVFFRIVLYHYVNWLGGCTAGGKKQNVLKICLLAINHEYDLATDEQNVHDLLNYNLVLRPLILSTVVLSCLFLSGVQYNFN